MRKLKDLKENEYIACSGKEIRKIAILMQKELNIPFHHWEIAVAMQNKAYMSPHNRCWVSELQPRDIAFSANHFIKPKKSKFKEVFQEIARLDGEVEYLKDFISNMHPLKYGAGIELKSNSIKGIHVPESFGDFKVKDRDCKSASFVGNPINKIKQETPSIHQNLIREEVAKHPDCYAKVNAEGTGLDFEPVLKTELEVGKWYKRIHNQALFCVVGNPNKEPFEVYGFDNGGSWMTSRDSSVPIQTFKDSEVLASNEEVEAALIAEAKKRGFKEGANFKQMATNKSVEINKGFNFRHYDGIETLCVVYDTENGGDNIFYNGRWAEIISQPEKEEEIDPLNIYIDYAESIIKQFKSGIAFVGKNKEARNEIITQFKKRMQECLSDL